MSNFIFFKKNEIKINEKVPVFPLIHVNVNRREIYFKELDITLETPLSELYERYDNVIFEIDRLSPKLIE